MATNTDASLSIGVDITNLEQGMKKAQDAVTHSVDKMQSTLSSINGAFQKVQGAFLAFTAAVAGGAAFKAVINASNEWALESGKLAKTLGTTTEQASIMRVALNHVGVESDTLISASQKMSKQIFTNGQAFEKLGVQVKDSQGQYRPMLEVMGEVNKKLVEIKNPIEQNIAGQQVYGKSWAEVKGILKLTADQMEWAKQRAKELHLIVGPDGEAQAKQYKAQMRDLNMVGKSLEVQFGAALTPVFVKLGSWMGNEAPRMGEIFKNVLLGIVAAAQTVWEVINGVGNALGGLAALGVSVASGDLAGAKVIWARMQSDASASAAKVKDIWAHAFDVPKAPGGNIPDISGGPTYDFSKDDKSGKDKSRMSAWESELAETKVFFQKQYELREYSKTQELEYWQSILRNVNVTGAERIAITKKVSELELEVMRKQIQQKKALDQEAINVRERVADDGLKREEMLSQQEFDLGRITKSELIALQQQYENRRFEIAREAQAARITAMLGDPNMDPVALQKLLDQMGEIQRRHDLETVRLSGDAAKETLTAWQQNLAPIGSAIEKSITGVIMGTQTLHKAMSNIFQSILGEFVNMCAQMVTRWMAMELAKTIGTKQGSTMRAVLEKMGLIETTTAQTTASAVTAATKGTEAMAVVGANAAEAASGAAASQAAIPFAGPGLAAAAFAAIMAMVLGAKSSIKSAAGGYDIPAGVNPMTQLHEREMVLPAKYADVIRGMADQGSSAPAAPSVRLELHPEAMRMTLNDWLQGELARMAAAR